MTQQTILLADDHRDLVRALEARCRRMGLRTLIAHDAMAALTAIREERPDLVCLDVNMPSGCGLSVVEMLAADENFELMPIIMLTGRSDHDTIRRCHNMCVYYVLKSEDIWERIEPLICELLEIEPLPSNDGFALPVESSPPLDAPQVTPPE